MDELLKLKEKYRILKITSNAQTLAPQLSAEKEATVHLIPGNSSHDLTFLKAAILTMYKEQKEILHVLYTNSNILLDRQQQPIQKHVMSNSNQLELKNIFARRLRRTGLSLIQYSVRMDKFNSLLSKALYKIRSQYTVLNNTR